MILWELRKKKKEILDEMNAIAYKFGPFPKEKLNCVANGKYFKYFQTDGHISTYIPKGEQDFACVLAKKEHYQRLETYLYHIQKMITYYERHIEQDQAEIDALFAPNSGYRPLLEATSKPKDYTTWATEPYETNPVYPEGKKFRT